MSLPLCPSCGSDDIRHGYPIINGHNKCGVCGHLAPVRDFHQMAEFRRPSRGRKTPMAVGGLVRGTTPAGRTTTPIITGSPKPEEHFWWQDT